MCLAVPGRVERLYQQNEISMGTIDFGGVAKDVCLVYVPEIQVGDYVIVHVGFAISRIDEASALETLRMIEQVGMLEDELAKLRESDS